jgi:thiol:disulfide interchange protein
MPPASAVPRELDYVLLLFALFVVPRILQRYRLPAAVSGVALGAAAGIGLALFEQDRTISLLSVFGGLIIYTLANTLIPGLTLRLPAPESQVLHASTLSTPSGQNDR